MKENKLSKYEEERKTEEEKLKEVINLASKQLEETEQSYERLEKTANDEFLLNEMRKNSSNKNEKFRKSKRNTIFCKNWL